MERHNQMLSEVFGIQTVAELRSNKYFALPERSSHSATRSSTADLLLSLIYLGFQATMISQYDP